MKTVDILFEYSHIYTDEAFGKEQLRSIEVLHKLEAEAQKEGKTTGRSILIDNYNPKKPTLDFNEFIGNLEVNNAIPDFIMMEETATIYAIFLIHKMRPIERKKYMRWIKSRKKMPCSLLLAIWHVIQLGELNIFYDEAIHWGHPVTGRNLTILLPERFREVEERGRKIIDSCNIPSTNNRITNIYIP